LGYLRSPTERFDACAALIYNDIIPTSAYEDLGDHGDLSVIQMLADKLLQVGAGIEGVQCMFGPTLDYAIMYGRLDVIRYLVEEVGVPLQARHLGYAVTNGKEEVAMYLRNRPGVHFDPIL